MNTALFEHVTVLSDQVVGKKDADILSRCIVGHDHVSPAAIPHDVQQLGVIFCNDSGMVPFIDNGGKGTLQVLEINQHTLFVRFAFHFDEHLIGMAVQIAAASFVPRQTMGAFPTESFGDFHGFSKSGTWALVDAVHW